MGSCGALMKNVSVAEENDDFPREDRVVLDAVLASDV